MITFYLLYILSKNVLLLISTNFSPVKKKESEISNNINNGFVLKISSESHFHSSTNTVSQQEFNHYVILSLHFTLLQDTVSVRYEMKVS